MPTYTWFRNKDAQGRAAWGNDISIPPASTPPPSAPPPASPIELTRKGAYGGMRGGSRSWKTPKQVKWPTK